MTRFLLFLDLGSNIEKIWQTTGFTDDQLWLLDPVIQFPEDNDGF